MSMADDGANTTTINKNQQDSEIGCQDGGGEEERGMKNFR